MEQTKYYSSWVSIGRSVMVLVLCFFVQGFHILCVAACVFQMWPPPLYLHAICSCTLTSWLQTEVFHSCLLNLEWPSCLQPREYGMSSGPGSERARGSPGLSWNHGSQNTFSHPLSTLILMSYCEKLKSHEEVTYNVLVDNPSYSKSSTDPAQVLRVSEEDNWEAKSFGPNCSSLQPVKS